MKPKTILKTISLLALGASLLSLSSCSLKGPRIGILQLATHPALDMVTAGFKEALEENGFVDGKNITIEVQNPNNDLSINTTMAHKLALSSDLLLGIATPSASALKKAIKDAGRNTPLIFAAVTDPVDEGLVSQNTAPGGNVSGISDMGPVKESIDLLKIYFAESTSKVGLLYNSAESNSLSQIALAKEAISENGWEIVDKGVTQISEITSTVSAMCALGVDAIYIPTDNLIASSMAALKNCLDTQVNKPVVITGDSNMLEGGGILSRGVDYHSIGRESGLMAVKVLNGTDIGTLDVGYATSFPLVVNKTLAESWGITLGEDLLSAAEEIL